MLELLGNGIVVLGFVLTGVAVLVTLIGVGMNIGKKFKRKERL